MLKYLSIILVLLTIVFLSPAIGADKIIFGSLNTSGSGESIKLIGRFDISIGGTWSGTTILSRKFKGGTRWLTVSTFTNSTANTETGGYQASQAAYVVNRTVATNGTVEYVIGWSGRAPR